MQTSTNLAAERAKLAEVITKQINSLSNVKVSGDPDIYLKVFHPYLKGVIPTINILLRRLNRQLSSPDFKIAQATLEGMMEAGMQELSDNLSQR